MYYALYIYYYREFSRNELKIYKIKSHFELTGSGLWFYGNMYVCTF